MNQYQYPDSAAGFLCCEDWPRCEKQCAECRRIEYERYYEDGFEDTNVEDSYAR